MSATTSVMSGLSGLASEKKAKAISPELQAELDAMPFYNVPEMECMHTLHFGRWVPISLFYGA